jgi:hypothetical protein
MSGQPRPEPIELPEIPPEERAELEALKQRILAGDRSDTVSWDELAAELGPLTSSPPAVSPTNSAMPLVS